MDGIIEFSEWQKIELRVAEIKKIEDIEGADKLYKLTLDVGKEIGKSKSEISTGSPNKSNQRIICAGIKEYYSKEELKGKKIVVFINLKPRLMKGIESQGMLLAAVSEDHSKIILISPEKDIENGCRIS
ncbi:MAG: tRNA-binding protein [Nanoarchaeota archaeon]